MAKVKKPKKVNSSAKSRKKKEFDWEAWEQEARRRSAWGEYVQTMSRIRQYEEENQYQSAKYKGDTEKVKQIENKRKNRTPMLYIG